MGRLLSTREPAGRRLFAFLTIGGETGCRTTDLHRALHIPDGDRGSELNRRLAELGFDTEQFRDDTDGRVLRVRLADPELWLDRPTEVL